MEVIEYQARDWIVEAMLSIQRYCAETYGLTPVMELIQGNERDDDVVVSVGGPLIRLARTLASLDRSCGRVVPAIHIVMVPARYHQTTPYCYCRYLDPGFELANAIERAAGSRSSGSI